MMTAAQPCCAFRRPCSQAALRARLLWLQRLGAHPRTCCLRPSQRAAPSETAHNAPELSLPWGLLGLFGGVISLLAGGLVGGYLLMKQANRLPAVFKPKQVQLVHYDLVHTPVRVRAPGLCASALGGSCLRGCNEAAGA